MDDRSKPVRAKFSYTSYCPLFGAPKCAASNQWSAQSSTEAERQGVTHQAVSVLDLDPGTIIINGLVALTTINLQPRECVEPTH